MVPSPSEVEREVGLVADLVSVRVAAPSVLVEGCRWAGLVQLVVQVVGAEAALVQVVVLLAGSEAAHGWKIWWRVGITLLWWVIGGD